MAWWTSRPRAQPRRAGPYLCDFVVFAVAWTLA
jgi:hypothetical protein